MVVLIDTGILLRLVHKTDALHVIVRTALRDLKQKGETLVTASQNVAEFWNVCTRPTTARGGYGLTVVETDRRLRLLERIIGILPDSPAAYPIWKNLVLSLAVSGVQVHDARLVALMMANGITHLVTLNAADFARYVTIIPIVPTSKRSP